MWFSLAAVAFWFAWQRLTSIPRLILLLAAGYLLTFPQIVQYAFLPDVEEGYIIPLLAFLFVSLLLLDHMKLDSNWPALLLLATLNAGLFLLKSSMLYVSLVFCAAFGLRSKSPRVFGVFLGLTLSVAMLWGALNLHHSGRFTIASSYDGLNFYKGNNPAAVSLYPPYNLDTLSLDFLWSLTPAPPNEWTVSKQAMVEAARFIQSHPREALRLFLGRLFVVFFEVRRTPIWPGEDRIVGFIQWTGVLYMLVFRVAFFAVAGYGLLRLLGRGAVARDCPVETLVFFSFLALTLAYTGPYLAGFAYERHVLPLIAPTIAYSLWLTQHRRLVEPEPAL